MPERALLMLATVSAIRPLPPDLERRAADEAIGQRLVGTPDDALEPDQVRVLQPIEVTVPVLRVPFSACRQQRRWR